MAFLAFLGFVNVYALRVNLSVALVAMVKSNGSDVPVNGSDECPGDNNTQPANSTQVFILRMHFFITPQIAQVAHSKLLTWARQLLGN